MDVILRAPAAAGGKQPVAVVLHLDGRPAALQHPLATAFVKAGWAVAAPSLRATGDAEPPHDSVRDAADHNTTEHALWVGRPLLGQWLFDVQVLLDWLALQPTLDRRRVYLVGVGPAGLVALVGGALWDDRVAGVVALEAPTSYMTDVPYRPPMRMGVLLPGVVGVGDVPQLAALSAPRRLVLADGILPQGARLKDGPMREAYAYTAAVYKAHRAAERLTVGVDLRPVDLVAGL
jgi:hypothetical protein